MSFHFSVINTECFKFQIVIRSLITTVTFSFFQHSFLPHFPFFSFLFWYDKHLSRVSSEFQFFVIYSFGASEFTILHLKRESIFSVKILEIWPVLPTPFSLFSFFLFFRFHVVYHLITSIIWPLILFETFCICSLLLSFSIFGISFFYFSAFSFFFVRAEPTDHLRGGAF